MSPVDATESVVISPFANERVREWPMRHYRRYIELVLREQRARVVVVGTRAQRCKANDLVRSFPSTDVLNRCGDMSWADLVALIDGATSVVANNSGIAHLAASRNRWTLCLFASSHSWLEWMPRGPRVVVISRVVPCAPCEIATNACPNGIVCMNDLPPDVAFERFREAQLGGA